MVTTCGVGGRPVNEMPHLSPRQIQVLKYTAEGLTMSEIGERLGITFHTVRVHSDIVRGRLGVKVRRQLIPLAQFYEWPKKEKAAK